MYADLFNFCVRYTDVGGSSILRGSRERKLMVPQYKLEFIPAK